MRRTLQLMKQFLDGKKAAFIVIGIDNAFTVDPDVYERHVARKDFQSELPLKRMGEVSKELGIRFVNALGELRALREKVDDKVYLGGPGDLSGHLRETAERLIGSLAAHELARSLELIEKPEQQDHANDS